MLADLCHTPHLPETIVTATTGRSKAIQLGTLATKRMRQEERKAAPKTIHEPGPNVIMGATTRFCWPRTTYSRDAGANAQVAPEKFARYFEAECPSVPISNESHYCLESNRAMGYVNEDTIGVFVILGSTCTHHHEAVKEVSDVRPLSSSSALRAVLILCSCLTNTRLARDTASPYMSAACRAGSSHRSRTQSSSGTSSSQALCLSTCLATASGYRFRLLYLGDGCVVWRGNELWRKHVPIGVTKSEFVDYPPQVRVPALCTRPHVC
jgi:hypothetical protein